MNDREEVAPPDLPVPAFEPTLRGWLQRIVVAWGTLLFRATFSVTAENRPDLSRGGPFILAPNHASLLDPPLLQLVFQRHLTFLMTERLYRIRGVEWFFRLWGVLPIPTHGRAGDALKGALSAIAKGRSVVIFPEGRISDDGCLQEAQGGVALLMARAGVPVIPVAILGTHKGLPRGELIPRPTRLHVRFGDPIAPPERLDRERRRHFAEEILDAVHALGVPRR